MRIYTVRAGRDLKGVLKGHHRHPTVFTRRIDPKRCLGSAGAGSSSELRRGGQGRLSLNETTNQSRHRLTRREATRAPDPLQFG